MDRERDVPESNAYWQQDDDGRFTLRNDAREAAKVDLSRQSVEVHFDDGFDVDLIVPDYVCAFDEAERQLGVPRVDDVRGPDGLPDLDARRGAELEAELNSETRTPEQWARGYAARALFLLNRDSADRELSGEENQAGYHLAHAVAAMDGQATDEQLDVRGHLEEASALLVQDTGDQRYGSPSLMCDKALAVFQYEDARQTLMEGQEEEALRSDGSVPREAESVAGRGDDGVSDWRFEPSRASRHSEREQEIARGIDADDSGREM
jgi:hypothetical protein